MEVREVTEDEAEEVGELVVNAYRAIPGTPPVEDDGYGAELRAVAKRAREAVVLVAVERGRVAGCITYVPDDASPLAEDLQPGEAGIRMPPRRRPPAATRLQEHAPSGQILQVGR